MFYYYYQAFLKGNNTYLDLGWNDPSNGDSRAKGDRNGGGHETCRVLCPWYVFFFFFFFGS